MIVAIIDYGSGNLRSAAKAFERAGRDHDIGVDVQVTADPDAVARADRIVLPGVGAFADCRRGLAAIDGLEQALEESVRARGRPFLGICVGMQLLADRGLEHGSCAGLGWIPGEVRALEPADGRLKIPHMGWNRLLLPERPHPVLSGLEPGAFVYFVHSYAFAGRPADAAAACDYGGRFTAAIARDNLFGTQFHPEKSQDNGQRLIAGFLRWSP